MLKAQSSKLKAQSSKLKAKLNFKSFEKSIKNTKGFTLLELVITVSVLGLATAIAVPNFTTMVQNNRIKTTTNHIISSLQFARQTAAIEQTQVSACSPVPDNPERCALANNWKNGVALLKGNAKVDKYTPPPPPAPPTPTAGPVKPRHPGYPSQPKHPGYPSEPKHPGHPPKPVKPKPPEKPVIGPPRLVLVPVPPVKPPPTPPQSRGHAYISYDRSNYQFLGKDSECFAGRYQWWDAIHVSADGKILSAFSNTYFECRGARGYSYEYGRSGDGRSEAHAFVASYNASIVATEQADWAEYHRQMTAHEQSKLDKAQAEQTNEQRKAIFQQQLAAYQQQVQAIDIQHQKDLQAHEAAYQQKVVAWQQQKTSIDQNHQAALVAWNNSKANIDNQHSRNMNNYYQRCANIDSNHQQNISNYHQQVAAHQRAWQKELDDHAAAMRQYEEDRTKDPDIVVTVEAPKTLLAHNPFSGVTVTSQLNSGVTAVVYNKDRVKNGHGQIHIEDKRGRGEHSRTICINILGNIKVVKGSESCQ